MVDSRPTDFRPACCQVRQRAPLACGLVIAALCSVGTAATEQAAEPNGNVRPTARQGATTAMIAEVVTNEHYRNIRPDDALPARVFANYLDALDPHRLIFLAADIERFRTQQQALDEILHDGTLTLVSTIFATFKQRLDERVRYALTALNENLQFTSDEYYAVDRSAAGWVETARQHDALWLRRVKHEFLSLRLAGRDDNTVRAILGERYRQLRKRHRELDTDQVFRRFINAYLAVLDPHSGYFLPRRAKRGRNRAAPLEGIGIQLKDDRGFVTIKRVFAGGAADRSGRLHVGDRIMAVGEDKDAALVDVVGWTLSDVVDLIRGPKGSHVRLQFQSPGSWAQDTPRQITLTRDRIKLEELRAWQSLIEAGDDHAPARFGVITIPSFYIDYAGYGRGAYRYASTSRDTEQLILRLHQDGIDGLIIDLCGNRGGALSEAVQLTGLFIESGPVVQVKDATGMVVVHRDTDGRVAYAGPLLVLVDRWSASASEIFAGAIQDYGRGIVVGEPTYGKGTVQKTFDLNDFRSLSGTFGQLVLTVAQYFRVTGDGTQLRGVVPDIVLPVGLASRSFGERSEPQALPWEGVPPVEYARVTAPATAEVKRRQRMRVRADPAFRYVTQRVTPKRSSRAAVRKISLDETRRRRDRDATMAARRRHHTELRTQLGLAPPPDDGDDASELQKRWHRKILLEAAHILRDAIEGVRTTR